MELQRTFSLLNVNRHGRGPGDIRHAGKHVRHEAWPRIQNGGSLNQANNSSQMASGGFQKAGRRGVKTGKQAGQGKRPR